MDLRHRAVRALVIRAGHKRSGGGDERSRKHAKHYLACKVQTCRGGCSSCANG
eukprot:SAG11_NODE_1267_length_5342_cov_1.772459_3_plen_53_part_00